MILHHLSQSQLDVKDKFLFWGVCFYILSQSYTIPIFDIGLNWTLFIRLSDLAFLCIVIGVLVTPFKNQNPFTVDLERGFYLIVLLMSFNVLINYFRGVLIQEALSYSYYTLYKMSVFSFIFMGVNKIRWTAERLKIVNTLFTLSALVIISGFFLIYYDVVDRKLLFSLFDEGTYLGPWLRGYLLAKRELGGFAGYNHILLILQLHVFLIYLSSASLRNTSGIVVTNLFFIATIIIGFMTSSRSATIGVIVFYLLYLWEVNKRKISSIYLILGIILLIVSPLFINFITTSLIEQTQLDRIKELGNLSNEEAWSGRFDIWEQSFGTVISGDVLSLLLGNGIGGLMARNAHNNYLQVFLETGFIGLVVFLFLIYKLLAHPKHAKMYSNALNYGLLGLLLSSMSQESLYPVVSFADNLGYLMVVLAIVFQMIYTEKGLKD